MEGKNLIAAKIMHSVKERLGGGYTVSLQEVTKNNDQKLTGLIIRHGEENAVPTIYIDGHICDCSTGVPLEAVTDKIIQAYHGSLPQGFDAESFRDFNWVKGRIIYQMINTSLNRALLKDVPSVPVMDLSLVFKVIVDTFDGAMATVLIRNSHLEELWGVGAETVYGLAKENTPRLLPATIAGLSDIFKDSGIPIDGDDLVDSLAPMYVLTNQRMLYGAAVSATLAWCLVLRRRWGLTYTSCRHPCMKRSCSLTSTAHWTPPI